MFINVFEKILEVIRNHEHYIYFKKHNTIGDIYFVIIECLHYLCINTFDETHNCTFGYKNDDRAILLNKHSEYLNIYNQFTDNRFYGSSRYDSICKVHYGNPDKHAEDFVNKKRFDDIGFCYIATHIYGSYSSSEVVTLRRFRDEYLLTSYFGRMFVKIYYFYGPTLVKYMENRILINKFVRKVLSKFVDLLNNKN